MCNRIFQVMASLPCRSDKGLSHLTFWLQKWPLIHDSGWKVSSPWLCTKTAFVHLCYLLYLQVPCLNYDT